MEWKETAAFEKGHSVQLCAQEDINCYDEGCVVPLSSCERVFLLNIHIYNGALIFFFKEYCLLYRSLGRMI